MIKAVKKQWPAAQPVSTPYQRARQEWDDRIGSAIVQARNWRLAAFVALATSATSVAGLVYVGTLPKQVPHIIEVDSLGAPAYRGPIGQSQEEYRPSELSMKYHLRRFIELTRSLSSDPAVIRRNWHEAYALVTESGAQMLNGHVAKANPFERAKKERMTVEVFSIVNVVADTWQIDWKETSWDEAGLEGASVVWRGMVRVVERKSQTQEQLQKNPLGLFIDEIHWDRLQP